MNKKALLGLILVVLFGFSTAIGIASGANVTIQTVFSINLLSPNTSPARNQWSLLMEQQLPKIGIGIAFHESTGWGNIAPRTWSYPLIDYDYIPTYDKGGFDILFVGWSWGLDWDPTGLFDTASLVPNGDNFYQYINPVWDDTLDEYLTALDPTVREQKAHDLQAILYEDNPAICLVYPRSLFGFRDTVTGIDGLLIASSNHRAENWDDTADHIIKYAIPADLREPNIYVVESFYDMQWIQTVYGALYKRAQDSHEWEPEIASTSVISDVVNDKINITVTLDPDAKFSNGDPVLPSDVKYSYELHMTPAVGSSSYGYLTKWFASNDSISIVGGPSGDIPGGQLLFQLNGVYNFARSLLSYGIIEKSIVETLILDHGYDIFNDMPGTGNVGWGLVTSCGPFMLDPVDGYDSVNSNVHMVPNPYWHGTPVKLTDWYLTFVAGKDNAVAGLIAGDYDIMDAQYFPVLADFEGQPGIEGVLVKDPAHQEMAINMKHPILGTGELTPVGTAAAANGIRKAISHAVPRQTIVDEILEGLGAPGVIAMPDAAVGFDESLQPYAYDLDLAIDYVEAAGYTVRVTESGISGLIFLSFLGLASLIALRRFKK
ncbi:MAG: ABC transporter substrate-binding protein [Candidatus Heimdallarchaeaceae archaeon]